MSKRKREEIPTRNWVAKNQKTSGSGRHKDDKNDYRRQPKHRNQPGDSHEKQVFSSLSSS